MDALNIQVLNVINVMKILTKRNKVVANLRIAMIGLEKIVGFAKMGSAREMEDAKRIRKISKDANNDKILLNFRF